MNIWIKKRDEPFNKARPLTSDEKRRLHPISGHVTANISFMHRIKEGMKISGYML
jgi:hypothetical protein